MSLNTGKMIHSYNWEALPIPDEVVTRVEELAESENQPTLIDSQPIFEWSPGERIDDEISTPIAQENQAPEEGQNDLQQEEESIHDQQQHALEDENEEDALPIISDEDSAVSYESEHENSTNEQQIYHEEATPLRKC